MQWRSCSMGKPPPAAGALDTPKKKGSGHARLCRTCYGPKRSVCRCEEISVVACSFIFLIVDSTNRRWITKVLAILVIQRLTQYSVGSAWPGQLDFLPGQVGLIHEKIIRVRSRELLVRTSGMVEPCFCCIYTFWTIPQRLVTNQSAWLPLNW